MIPKEATTAPIVPVRGLIPPPSAEPIANPAPATARDGPADSKAEGTEPSLVF